MGIDALNSLQYNNPQFLAITGRNASNANINVEGYQYKPQEYTVAPEAKAAVGIPATEDMETALLAQELFQGAEDELTTSNVDAQALSANAVFANSADKEFHPRYGEEERLIDLAA